MFGVSCEVLLHYAAGGQEGGWPVEGHQPPRSGWLKPHRAAARQGSNRTNIRFQIMKWLVKALPTGYKK